MRWYESLWLDLKWYLAGVWKGLLNIYKSKTFWALISFVVVDRLKKYGHIPDSAVTDALEVVSLALVAIFRAGATQDLQEPK